MKKTMLFAAALLLLSTPRPAFAYLDAGSGSMLLQLLLGGVAGLLVIAKLYWRRLLELFGLRKDVIGEGKEDTLRSEQR